MPELTSFFSHILQTVQSNLGLPPGKADKWVTSSGKLLTESN
jgi:hypothetical protein